MLAILAMNMTNRIDPDRRLVLQTLAHLGMLAIPFGPVLAWNGRSPDAQPLLAQVRRLVEAMEYLGEPLSEAERAALQSIEESADAASAVVRIEKVLAPRVLAEIRINPESRVSITRGAAEPHLVEHGWRAFLLKVHNEAGVTAKLTVESPQAKPVYRPGTGNAMAPQSIKPADIADRWLALESYEGKPMEPQLSGLELEYRILLLYSRDRGRREAHIGAAVGAGSEDIGFRNRMAVVFRIDPSQDVTVRVRDEHGRPTTASFLVEDRVGRVYPTRAKRLAPDFFFQKQVYRADGETLRLPTGEFTVTCGRGPEYVPERRLVRMGTPPRTERAVGTPPESSSWDFKLKRWIDPAAHGWYSGDHHIHAAGCSHYESPTEGVRPDDMMRQVLGEALSVGSVLNWGPSYYHQRRYFEGKDNKLSTASTLLRYDLEVSGFPSSHCGHLVLLRVREQDYPETRQIEDWPSWDLPILKWARAQKAVTGFAHSGWGLQVKSRELPNYDIPPFDGIGANEFIVDVTHDVVDFISTADTPYPHELNIWYHTLNCGYRTRVSGETDFPCITDERVGGGRSYVHIAGPLSYDAWCEGVRNGRCYVSDGFSHLLDFTAGGVAVGTGSSELALDRGGKVSLTARVASLLPEQAPASGPPEPIQRPYWTPEHARVANTRDVTVEAIVNGRPVASQRVPADGTLRPVKIDVDINRSSWVALRIIGSAHTNPVFVQVGGRPIRASRKSAEWCLASVDRCWSQKSARIRARERDAATLAYDRAREAYRRILGECDTD